MVAVGRVDPRGGIGMAGVDAAALLGWLNPALKATLADLAQASPSIANAVVQLLPFDTRAALLELALAERSRRGQHAPSAVRIRLTALAQRVTRAAAAEADADPRGVERLLRHAQEAAGLGAVSSRDATASLQHDR